MGVVKLNDYNVFWTLLCLWLGWNSSRTAIVTWRRNTEPLSGWRHPVTKRSVGGAIMYVVADGCGLSEFVH